MGLFNKNKEEPERIYKLEQFKEAQENSLFEDVKTKLFEEMVRSNLRLGFILNTFDIKDYSEFWGDICNIEEIGDDFGEANLLLSVCESNILCILRVLGWETTVKNHEVVFASISIADSVKCLINESYNSDILDIKFIAYIEGNTEVFEAIPYGAEDESYSLEQLVEFCNKLHTIKYENFEIKMR